jgi:hypothetical protein
MEAGPPPIDRRRLGLLCHASASGSVKGPPPSIRAAAATSARQPTSRRRYAGRVTSPEEPASVRPVEYKGEPLDSDRGPGLGCFRFQVVLLVGVIILTPLSVVWQWPTAISAALLFLTIFLLLFAGQTVIFLLRLVAADRREGRRRPLGSATPTVGELEDAATAPADTTETAPESDAHNDDRTPPSGVRE